MPETGPQTIYKYSSEAMETLQQLARDKPSLWRDPATDFTRELANLEVPPERAIRETGLTCARKISLPAPPAQNHRKPTADAHALSLFQAIPGITPAHLTDVNMLAWMSCNPLLEYGIQRWPLTASQDPTRWVRQHFLARTTRELTNASVAGRTLWIAELSLRAARETNSLKAQDILDHFAHHQEHYHQCTQFQVMRSNLVFSEYVLALITQAQGIKIQGAYEVARDLNRAAGSRLLDVMPRAQVRQLAEASVDRVMRIPTYVADRNALRGRTPLRVLSLGAGVQSTAMALMAETGHEGMEKPDLAIFADTGWEPPAVYRHLEWLETQLSYPLITVSAGNIRTDILNGRTPTGRNFIPIPAFTTSPGGAHSVSKRQCTSEYKLRPIIAEVRRQLGIPPHRRSPKDRQAEMWIGITTDEAARAKPSQEEFITNRWPLLERDYNRYQVLTWLTDRYPDREIPRSACIGCPYRTNTEWKHMKETDPDSFEQAIHLDTALRGPDLREVARGVTMFLHPSRLPLYEVDLSTATDQADRIQQECEGLCKI